MNGNISLEKPGVACYFSKVYIQWSQQQSFPLTMKPAGIINNLGTSALADEISVP